MEQTNERIVEKWNKLAIALKIEFGYVKSREFGANCLGNIYRHTLLLVVSHPSIHLSARLFFFPQKLLKYATNSTSWTLSSLDPQTLYA